MMRKTGFLRKAQHPLLIAAGLAPLAVLLVERLSLPWNPTIPLMGLLYVVMAWACILLPGSWRIPCAAGGSILLFVVGSQILPLGANRLLLLVPAGYAVLLLAGLPVGGWPAERELPPLWGVAGLLAHLLAQLFSDAAPAYLLMSFLIFAAMQLLALNRTSLNAAAQSRVSVPLQMRRKNTLLTLGLLGISVMLAALPAIGHFLHRVWDGLLRAVKLVAAFLASLLSRQGGDTGGAGANALIAIAGGEEITEPGFFQKMLEVLAGVAAMLALAALLLWIGRKLFRRLKTVLVWLWQNLNRFSNAAVKDYVDEITDTRDDAQYQRTGLFKQMRRRLHRADEQKMSAAERMRYCYLRLRLRHAEWTDASTARENLPANMAQLYERARYGDGVVTQEEAEQFSKRTQRI